MAGFDNTIVFSAGERLTASSSTDIARMQETVDSVSRINHVGDPEGVVSANPSSLSHDPTSGNIYRKATGTGNTGWVLISSGGSVTITADDGNSLTVSPYDLFGQKAGVVPVNSSTVDTGVFYMANNTWQTQYVVDASTTPGLKGTFQTIQSAITQAVADGASLSVQKGIYIRYGAYTEDLTIPPGIFLVGESLWNSVVSLPHFTSITGNHTLGGTNVFKIRSLYFINPSPTADLFTCDPIVIFNVEDCTFNSSSTGLLMPLNYNYSVFRYCNFTATAYQTSFGLTTSGGNIFIDCVFNGVGFDINESDVLFLNCYNVGPCICTNGAVNAQNTSFSSSALDSISGTGSGLNLYYCNFNGQDTPLNYTPGGGGGNIIVGCSGSGGGSTGIYTAPSRPFNVPTQAGSVYNRQTAASTLIDAGGNQFYIGVNDTSSSRTVRLPTVAAPDASWIIKDESLVASVNPITVIVLGGTGLIDGQTSYLINTNGGSVQLISDGTGNYFIMNQNKSASFITGTNVQILAESPEIDFTQTPAVIDLFILPVKAVMLGLMVVNTDFTGTMSQNPLGTFGTNSPTYDDIAVPAISTIVFPIPNGALGINSTNGAYAAWYPAGSDVKLNLTQEAISSGNVKAKVQFLGYPIP